MLSHNEHRGPINHEAIANLLLPEGDVVELDKVEEVMATDTMEEETDAMEEEMDAMEGMVDEDMDITMEGMVDDVAMDRDEDIHPISKMSIH